MITQEQLDNAILEEMGRPGWELIKSFLAQQVIIARDSCADATSWEDCVRRKGFAEGLYFVINLRDDTERARNASV